MKYGSVCSGIEAASVAWESLGWRAAWFAEIDAFPSAVLKHHWPGVPNLGDMTLIAAAVRAGTAEAPDVLVGGTPCQAFSLAGLRTSLADERGQLTLSYVELANAIDEKRAENGEKPVIAVWENVPGVLTTKDNAFGCFIAAMAGENVPLEPGPRPERGKSNERWRWNKKTSQHVPRWPKRGCVIGRQRKLAWRTIDAQYVGVAQRRKRVFVVASARNDIDTAAILFEFEGVRRDTPPRREPSSEITGNAGASSESGSHWDSRANPHPTLNQSHNTGGIGASNQEIFAQRGAGLVAKSIMGDITHTLSAEGADASEDGTGRGTPIIAMAHGQSGAEIKVDNSAPTLTCNHEAPIVVGQFSSTGAGTWSEGAGTLRARTQESHEHLAVLAFPERCAAAVNDLVVRRLTPRECERLQGFPDDHTLVPYGRKISPEKMDHDFAKYLMRGGKLTFEECCGRAADGPRYKAIGNSMAVPVMHWIGRRIDESVRKSSSTDTARNSGLFYG